MELMSFFKNNLRAVFILALIFTGLDPGGLKSQCIDVKSSHCFVNVADIPYDLYKHTVYEKRPKPFFETIRKNLIFADTCNPNWKYGDRYLYFHSFNMFINIPIFNNYVKLGDTNITKDDISANYLTAKNILNQFETEYCKIKFEILDLSTVGYTVKCQIDGNLQDSINSAFWWKLDSNHEFFYYSGGTLVEDLTTYDVKQIFYKKLYLKQLDEDHILIYYTDLINGNNIDIYDILGLNRINTITSGYETTINTSNLSKGLYFIKIDNQFQKFIKE
jgi:hypothetical protein